MFVNSCLIKVCFVWMNSCIFFVSVCNKFLLFLLAFSRLLQLTHNLDLFDFYCFLSIQYCQTSRCYHVFGRRELQSFHTAIQQKLSRTDALKQDGETTKWYGSCSRWHLTLHTKTVLFHCLWVSYTFHSILRCNNNNLLQGNAFFLCFNKPFGPDREM